MKKDIEFNMNKKVKVKLTQEGKNVLCKRFLENQLLIKDSTGEINLKDKKPPLYSKDGWYESQLWILFQRFGEYIGMAKDLMFETIIILKDVEI